MSANIKIDIPLNALALAIAEQILPALRDLKQLQAVAPKEPNEKYLTRKETATSLNVSLPTLTQYTKYGKIIGYRFGTRVLYKQSDISNALLKIKGGGHE